LFFVGVVDVEVRAAHEVGEDFLDEENLDGRTVYGI